MRDSHELVQVSLSGSPIEMGSAHGELLADEICQLADVRLSFLTATTGASVEQVRSAAQRLVACIARTLPDVDAEARASAAAANVEYWKLVCAGAVSDIADLLVRASSVPRPTVLSECTLTSHPVGNGIGIVGTWDTHAEAASSAVICRRSPSNGPATLALTTPGWPMQQGVTERGLAFAIANLVSTRTRDGVPYIAALPDIMSAVDIDTLLVRATSIPHASARYYIFADGMRVRGVEIAPGVGSRIDANRIQTHTNHFTAQDLVPHDGRDAQASTSASRLRALEAWIQPDPPSDPRIILESAAAAPFIQRSQDPGGDCTGLIFALDSAARTIHYIAAGGPSGSGSPVVQITLD